MVSCEDHGFLVAGTLETKNEETLSVGETTVESSIGRWMRKGMRFQNWNLSQRMKREQWQSEKKRMMKGSRD